MNLIRNILSLALIVPALAASAQYNPTVEVEGDYAPDYIPQDRINSFPQRDKFKPIEGSLSFDARGVVTPFSPSGVPMEATGWQTSRTDGNYRGYLDLSIGSWLNARLNAGYRFLDNKNTSAGVYLLHNSTSLWKPKMCEQTEDTRREMYDETIGTYLTHKADGKGVLSMDLHYNLAYFNYYGCTAGTGDYTPTLLSKVPTQTWNDASLSLLWESDKSRTFGYHLGVNARYSSFRRAYYPWLDIVTNADGSFNSTTLQYLSIKGRRETDISVPIGIKWRVNEVSSWGLDLTGQIVVGPTGKENFNYYGEEKPLCSPSNHGMLTILPYYRYEKGNLSLRIAPRIDLAFNTVNKFYYFIAIQDDQQRGKVFHIAPDLRLDWHTKKFAITVEATGGAYLNTLGREHDLDFYCQPYSINTLPTYTPIDAKASIGFGPFGGFQGSAYVGYRTTLNQRLAGLYQAYLNEDIWPWAGDMNYETTHKLYGFSVGMQLKWSYGDLISLLCEGTFQPQNHNFAYFNGLDMPRATLHASIASSPIEKLHLALDYDLRALRMPLLDPDRYDIIGSPADSNYEYRLPNWSNLSFSASYDVLKNLSVGLTLDNLLCRRQYILYDLPTPRLTAMANLSWKF